MLTWSRLGYYLQHNMLEYITNQTGKAQLRRVLGLQSVDLAGLSPEALEERLQGLLRARVLGDESEEFDGEEDRKAMHAFAEKAVLTLNALAARPESYFERGRKGRVLNEAGRRILKGAIQPVIPDEYKERCGRIADDELAYFTCAPKRTPTQPASGERLPERFGETYQAHVELMLTELFSNVETLNECARHVNEVSLGGGGYAGRLAFTLSRRSMVWLLEPAQIQFVVGNVAPDSVTKPKDFLFSGPQADEIALQIEPLERDLEGKLGELRAERAFLSRVQADLDRARDSLAAQYRAKGYFAKEDVAAAGRLVGQAYLALLGERRAPGGGEEPDGAADGPGRPPRGKAAQVRASCDMDLLLRTGDALLDEARHHSGSIPALQPLAQRISKSPFYEPLNRIGGMYVGPLSAGVVGRAKLHDYLAKAAQMHGASPQTAQPVSSQEIRDDRQEDDAHRLDAARLDGGRDEAYGG